MKLVLDSNVLIAAFMTHGLCESVLATCLMDHEVVISAPILSEVKRGLERKVKVPASVADDAVSFLRKGCSWTEPLTVPKSACRDPDDLLILGTAESAKADFIVTGDQDLLVLKRYKGILILSPREFWQRIQSKL